MMTRLAQRRSDERGQLAGIEMLPLGVLVFAVGVLFFAQLWAVVDAKSATESAAREATRTFVEAQADVGAAEQQARSAALDVLTAAGRDAARATVRANGSLVLERCAPVTFEVSYSVPVVALSFLTWGNGFEVTSSHTEIVDPYRDALDGGRCG